MGRSKNNMTRLFLACLFVAALGVSICDADGSCTAPPSDAQAFTNKYDKFQLTYFDGRGLAEVPRMLLALSGRFPGAGFDDVRMTGDMFSQMKGSGISPRTSTVPLCSITTATS